MFPKIIEFRDWQQMINWSVNMLQSELDFESEQPTERVLELRMLSSGLEAVRKELLESVINDDGGTGGGPVGRESLCHLRK